MAAHIIGRKSGVEAAAQKTFAAAVADNGGLVLAGVFFFLLFLSRKKRPDRSTCAA
jgi:hypothetical protein